MSRGLLMKNTRLSNCPHETTQLYPNSHAGLELVWAVGRTSDPYGDPSIQCEQITTRSDFLPISVTPVASPKYAKPSIAPELSTHDRWRPDAALGNHTSVPMCGKPRLVLFNLSQTFAYVCPDTARNHLGWLAKTNPGS